MHEQPAPVAVVGIGCRFPPLNSGPEEFWASLTEGVDAVCEVPDDRWRREAYFDPDASKPARMNVDRAAFLHQRIEEFDASFFGIAPREAGQLDPQQRLLLEVSWEALEDSGSDVWSLRGSRTGVYVGAFTLDIMLSRTEPSAREEIGPQTALTCTHTVLASRLAYFYDFRGPCMTIDTACSSSLVAIHEGVRALAAGDSDLVLAGGVNRIFRPETNLMMSKGHFLAPDGRSKSFSASADGYGRGEGCGMVVLKRLDDAERDGDRIYAIVEGTGVNQDGRTGGPAFPSVQAQADLVRTVTQEGGIDPATISFVEAHGTGTFVGDPVEMQALGEVIGRAEARQAPCVVGSVKSGIGHLEGAAGVAGFIKGALVAHHGWIPRQAWLDEINPEIDFEGLGLEVAADNRPLGEVEGVQRVAVNSFGYGGTNAHAVLRRPGRSAKATAQLTDAPMWTFATFLPVSAHSDAALADIAGSYAQLFKELRPGASGEAVVRRIAARTPHEHRRVLMGDTTVHADLMDVLAAGGSHPDIISGRALGNRTSQPVFVFSGMGPQWWGMGRGLLEANTLFRAHADRCDELFGELSGWSIVDEMLAAEDVSRITATDVAQPANFVLQTGLAKVLQAAGIEPAAVVGHSVGEVAAAYVAGSLTLEDALAVAYHRSRLQATTVGTGGMLATDLSEQDARDIIGRYEPAVSIAAVNGPTATTIAGDQSALEEIQRNLAAKDAFCRMLRVEVPYHSPAMDPILDELRAKLRDVKGTASTTLLYSTVDETFDGGTWDSDYWAANVRQPVDFMGAVQRLLDNGFRLFTEIGAHPVLAMYLTQMTSGARDSAVLPTLHRERPDEKTVSECIARSWVHGVAVDWQAILGNSDRKSLPLYPWQRQEHWQESPTARRIRTGETGHHHRLHGRLVTEGPRVWDIDISPTPTPWTRQHRVGGAEVFPAAGLLEVLVCHALRDKAALPVVIEDVSIDRPLVLPEHEDPVLRLVEGDDGRTTLLSRRRGDLDAWRPYGSGRVGRGKYSAPPRPADRGPTQAVDVTTLYDSFSRLGLDYEGPFCAITALEVGDDFVTAKLDVIEGEADGYTIYPPLLDAGLQGLLALQELDSAAVFVPVGVHRMTVFRELTGRTQALSVVRERTDDTVRADVYFFDDEPTCSAVLRGVEFRLVARKDNEQAWLDERTYELIWEPLAEPSPRAGVVPSSWLVVGDSTAASLLTADGSRSLGITQCPDWDSVNDSVLADVDAVLVVQAAPNVDAAIDNASDALAMVQRVVRVVPPSRQVEMVFLTRSAFAVQPADRAAGWLSSWTAGFRRGVANELDRLTIRLIDDDGLDPAACTSAILDVDADELALRAGAVFIPTLGRRPMRERERSWWNLAPIVDSAAVENFALVNAEPSPQGLRWVSVPRREPLGGEIELRVEAVGLNFKDVLKNFGFLSSELLARTFFGSDLGLEQSVVVERLGAGVTSYKVGDRLVGALRGGFRRYVTVNVDEARLIPTPASWTDVQAAGQLVALGTAHQTLVELGRLHAGESVLIHSATGGVGLASLMVAQRIGARVFATAGTHEKRELLRRLGAEYTFDSRSLDFVDGVFEATGGRGVDVIVNTLPGDGLRANLEIAAEGGRVVEISKREIVEGGSLPLDLFDKNVTLASCDLDYLANDREAFIDLGEACLGRVDAGEYDPVPVTAFPAGAVEQAFTALARAEHTGKLVIDLSDTSGMICTEDPACRNAVAPDRSYLVTGGTGGVGLQVARWLADQGARRVLLVSRRGYLDPMGILQVEMLRHRGVEVVVGSVDVTDVDSVRAFLEQHFREDFPLAGIVHAAGISHDFPVLALTEEDLRLVFAPKLRGAVALHEATSDLPLDFFILTSSVSTLTGTSGQAAYAGANTVLEGFAQWRRRLGMPAAAVSLGPVADVGMAARDQAIERYVSLLGFTPLPLDHVGAAFGRVAQWNRPVLGIFDVDWLEWSLAEPRAASSGRLVHLMERARSSAGTDLGSVGLRLAGLSATARVEALAELVAEGLAMVLGSAVEDLDVDGSLSALGLDSLMLVEFQTHLNRALGAELSLMGLIGSDSIREVARGLDEKLRESDA